jgi:TIR domain
MMPRVPSGPEPPSAAGLLRHRVVAAVDIEHSSTWDRRDNVTALPACGVFISYRRCDAGPYARLLQVQLTRRLPHTPVFMDLDSIEAGTDFAEAIKAGVGSCRVLIALIGPRWLTATATGSRRRRRLDDPGDYVRFEIRTALERRARVIPVLVDGATMPDRRQLPDDLAPLARLNALPISYDRYEYDEGRLITAIQKLLAAEAPTQRNDPDYGSASSFPAANTSDAITSKFPQAVGRSKARNFWRVAH